MATAAELGSSSYEPGEVSAGDNCYYFNDTLPSHPWLSSTYRTKIKKVVIEAASDGTKIWGANFNKMFSKMTSLASFEGASNIDGSRVVSLARMFKGCSSLVSIDLSGMTIDVSAPTTSSDGTEVATRVHMEYMFNSCPKLKSAVIPNMNVSKKPDLYIEEMFGDCKSLESVDFTPWDGARVRTIQGLFDMYSYSNSTALHTVSGLGGFKIDIAHSNTGVYNGNMGLMYLFWGCTSLSSIDGIEKWDTSTCENFNGTFYNCRSLAELDLSRWSGDGIAAIGEGVPLARMFEGCTNLRTINLTGFFESGLPQDRGKDVNAQYCFAGCENLESIEGLGDFLAKTNDRLNNMNSMFKDCHKLKEIDTSRLKTSHVTSMKEAFSGCMAVESLDFSLCNTTGVTTMNSMFADCRSLKSVNLASFDTSKVTDMNSMFRDCWALERLDLSNINTAACTSSTACAYFFENDSNLSVLKAGPSFKFTDNMHLPAAQEDKSWRQVDENAGGSETSPVGQTFDSPVQLANFHNSQTDTQTYVQQSSSVFSISFDLAGGYWTPADYLQVSAHATYSKDDPDPVHITAAPKRYGYEFVGWSYSASDGTVGTATEVFIPAGSAADFVYTAQWNMVVSTNTITYIGEDGLPFDLWADDDYAIPCYYDGSGILDVYGNRSTLPAASDVKPPDGYSFEGWYLDAACTNGPVSDSSGFSGDVQLYAKFALVEYSITYNLAPGVYWEDDSGNRIPNPNPTTYTVNDSFSIEEPLMDDYGFIGWEVVDGEGNRTYMWEMSVEKGTKGDLVFNATRMGETEDNSWIKIKPVYLQESGGVTWELMSDGTLYIYPTAGDRTGSVCGTLDKWGAEGAPGSAPWTNKLPTGQHPSVVVKKVAIGTNFGGDKTGKVLAQTCAGLFSGLSACRSISGLDSAHFGFADGVTSMHAYRMFYGCGKLKSIDLSFLAGDVARAPICSVQGMFQDCKKLSSVNMPGFESAGISSTASMFQNCNALSSLDLDMSKLDTTGCKSMRAMFQNCSSLQYVDVSPLDTSACTDFTSMFEGCTTMDNIPVHTWDTSSATSMESMFKGCANAAVLDVSGWQTSQVGNFKHMFDGCNSVSSLDVARFDTSNADSLEFMFNGCWAVQNLDVGGWDVSQVTSTESTFANCRSIRQISFDSWNSGNVFSMKDMLFNCDALETVDLTHLDSTGCEHFEYMFSQCEALKNVIGAGDPTSSVFKSVKGSFFQGMFSECTALETLNLAGFLEQTVMPVEYPNDPFAPGVGVLIFGPPHNLEAMFARCTSLTNLDTSGWNTTKITTMRSMFQQCTAMTELDISSFATPNVNDMSYMFISCEKLQHLFFDQSTSASVTAKSDSELMFLGDENIVVARFGEDFKFGYMHEFPDAQPTYQWRQVAEYDGGTIPAPVGQVFNDVDGGDTTYSLAAFHNNVSSTSLYADDVPYQTYVQVKGIYKVVYHKNADSATGKEPGPDSYQWGDTVTVRDPSEVTAPDTPIERFGYTFRGWSTDPEADPDDATAYYLPGATFVMPPEDVDLYAVWDPDEYTITYHPGDDGTNTAILPGPGVNPTVYTIESGAITLTPPVRPGYIFTGWTGTKIGDGTDAATPQKNVTIPAGCAPTDGDREYTAHWKKNENEFVDLVIRKVWDDASNKDELRPWSVSLKVMRTYIDTDGTPVTEPLMQGTKPFTVRLSSANATDETGNIWERIEYGLPLFDELPNPGSLDAPIRRDYVYSVEEVSVPEGYEVSYATSLSDDGAVATVTAVNMHHTELPTTGGAGVWPLVLMGVLLVVGGFVGAHVRGLTIVSGAASVVAPRAASHVAPRAATKVASKVAHRTRTRGGRHG